MDDLDFTPLMLPLATDTWGEPNRARSNEHEVRWGARGSRSVDLTKGQWFDFSMNEGGGVIDFVERVKGVDRKQAVQWLRDNGYLEQKQPERRQKREIEAVYDYVDEAGEWVCQVVRFKKPADPRFGQRRKAKDGSWIWGLSEGAYGRFKPGGDWYRDKPDRRPHFVEMAEFGDTPKYLYRLPEIEEVIANEQTVFLPEGEKDVDSVWKLGFPATCNIGGAGKWQASFSEVLRGAHVVILPDNDKARKDGKTPAGERHKNLVGAALKGVAASVRVLHVPGHKDVSDWIAAGGTADEFLKLVDAAEPWRPAPPKSKFGGFLFKDLDSIHGEEYEFLIDDFISRGDRSLVYGASKSGKSFLAIDMAMCVARGRKFFGKAVRKGGVIYQAGEGQKGVKKRLRAYRRHNDMPIDAALDFVLMPATIDLYHRDGDVDGFIAECKEWAAVMVDRLELVVIDTLSTATAGADENSAKDMSVVLANCAKVSKELNAHVMLVHHMNAGGQKPRGHTSIFANIDNAIQVDRNEESGVRTAWVTKQKDGDDSAKIRFELCSIEIGRRDFDDKPITSCVVIDVGTKDQAKAADRSRRDGLDGHRRDLFDALNEALLAYGEAPPAELKLPPSVRMVVRRERVYEEFSKRTSIDNPDQKKREQAIRQALSRETRALRKKQLMGFITIENGDAPPDKWAWAINPEKTPRAPANRDAPSMPFDDEDPFGNANV